MPHGPEVPQSPGNLRGQLKTELKERNDIASCFGIGNQRGCLFPSNKGHVGKGLLDNFLWVSIGEVGCSEIKSKTALSPCWQTVLKFRKFEGTNRIVQIGQISKVVKGYEPRTDFDYAWPQTDI